MLPVSNEHLKRFNLFSNFTDQQYAHINKYGKQVVVPAGKVILKLDSKLDNIFLLLEGELKLTAEDDKKVIISDDCRSANNPIAGIRPSRYKVISHTESRLLLLSKKILDQAIALEEEIEHGVISVESLDNHDAGYDLILFNILSLLHTEQLILPSLPDIALKVRHAVENEDSNVHDIIKIINMDQSIVTKIIKTANSAMYNTSGKNIESTKAAFLRIGTKKLLNLVLSYSLKELFKSDSSALKSKMKEVWQHSVKVAAISSIISRVSSLLDPEKALLAGLLHNIGAVALLNNLQHEPSLYEDENQLENMLFDLQSEIGESILSQWKFPDELINAAKYSNNWYHSSGEDFDYSDIVKIAQAHAFIGTGTHIKLPAMEEMPAFKKLPDGVLTPKLSLQILKKSESDINQIISLFN